MATARDARGDAGRHDGMPEEVSEGVWRIELPLPFALRWVNVYVLRDDKGGWTLVDAGLGLKEDREALRDGLAAIGVEPRDLSAIILTHAHPDHIGQSGALVREANAPVHMLPREADNMHRVWGLMDEEEGLFAALKASYVANGMPEAGLEHYEATNQGMRRVLRLPHREGISALRTTGKLRLGTQSWQVIWTPGHSDYHACLLRDDGLFIAGDMILPHITPNIGLYPKSRPNPLQDYFESLAKVRDLPVTLVLPGHGAPFRGLAARADALRDHHVERSGALREVLAQAGKPVDAYAAAGELFGKRLRGPDDWRFAMVETMAHLAALRAIGVARRTQRAGRVLYGLEPTFDGDR